MQQVQHQIIFCANCVCRLSVKSGVVFIECVVGFGVIQHPRSMAYVSTVPHPKLAIVRLSNELQRIADGPISLLEATNIHIFYKKVLQSK